MGEWQPIKTAPKDGTLILVTFDNHVWTAYWHRYQGRGPYRKYPWVCQSGQNAWLENIPTHWQPLPAPPAPSPVEKEER